MKESYKVLSIVCLFLVVVSVAGFMRYENDKPLPETNYKGLVKLGLAPSTYSRMPGENDIYTDVVLTDGVKNYALFESRTFKEGDYGKTFIVAIN